MKLCGDQAFKYRHVRYLLAIMYHDFGHTDLLLNIGRYRFVSPIPIPLFKALVEIYVLLLFSIMHLCVWLGITHKLVAPDRLISTHKFCGAKYVFCRREFESHNSSFVVAVKATCKWKFQTSVA